MHCLDRAGRRGRRRALVATVCIALVPASGALAAPASASAATIHASKACYVNTNTAQGSPVTVLGTGFNPNDRVSIAGPGVFATATAGPTGSFVVTTAGPILTTSGPAASSVTLTATDEAIPGITATTTIRVANLAAVPKPLSVKNLRKDKVTFYFSGFRPGKRIYGYYLRKKVVARATFGRAKGACGLLKQKALLYPGGHPHAKQYTIVFEQSKRFSARVTPRFSGTLSIFAL